jgi:alkyl hydroperoxide reductase subunit AhpC
VIVSCDIVIDEIGRWAKELIRRLAALEQNFDHKDTMCPSSREPGEKTLINPNWTTFKSEDFFL